MKTLASLSSAIPCRIWLKVQKQLWPRVESAVWAVMSGSTSSRFTGQARLQRFCFTLINPWVLTDPLSFLISVRFRLEIQKRRMTVSRAHNSFAFFESLFPFNSPKREVISRVWKASFLAPQNLISLVITTKKRVALAPPLRYNALYRLKKWSQILLLVIACQNCICSWTWLSTPVGLRLLYHFADTSPSAWGLNRFCNAWPSSALCASLVLLPHPCCHRSHTWPWEWCRASMAKSRWSTLPR